MQCFVSLFVAWIYRFEGFTEGALLLGLVFVSIIGLVGALKRYVVLIFLNSIIWSIAVGSFVVGLGSLVVKNCGDEFDSFCGGFSIMVACAIAFGTVFLSFQFKYVHSLYVTSRSEFVPKMQAV